MRILIGYNGSEAAMAALYDLRFAGMPDATEAVVFSVCEEWNKPRSIEDARILAQDGMAILTREFPTWQISAEAAKGNPANEIIARSFALGSDLIVVGESEVPISAQTGRVGQTSQKILTDAECSVRVCRGQIDELGHPERILVGFDGSEGSLNAVNLISARKWKNKPDVQLLAVADTSFLTSIRRFTPEIKNAATEAKFASQWAETLASESLKKLTNAGVSASVAVKFGHPKETIIEEAKRWSADAIYVGPHCNCNSFERFLLGSVSSAVAARAHCSVEVVRAR